MPPWPGKEEAVPIDGCWELEAAQYDKPKSSMLDTTAKEVPASADKQKLAAMEEAI